VRTEAPPRAIKEAAKLLADAKRPLIVAQRGAGSVAGFDALAQLAED
jgi:acetolactate synthase-1/2/3 large subunit